MENNTAGPEREAATHYTAYNGVHKEAEDNMYGWRVLCVI